MLVFVTFSNAQNVKPVKNNNEVFCFYYNWYGNPEHDGKYIHWAHPVLKPKGIDSTQKITGGDNVAANFYPLLGPYSSNDAVVTRKHMRMMAKAGIDVVVVTWWNKGDFTDKSIPLILDEAMKNGVKVAFHIEPFSGRNARTTKAAIEYIIDTYGMHPAFYRSAALDGKTFFFMYDSYLTTDKEWATLLLPGGDISIRNTKYDAIMIGLWVKKGEEEYFLNSGFDGFYTYFASEGFTYGSTVSNWPAMNLWAKENNKIFIPCVGPGYIDTRVRPWNDRNTKDRESGKYYDQIFSAAMKCKTKYIGITSFNEWHEGTQIEPAKPFHSQAFNYLDYLPQKTNYYLKRTKYWTNKFQKQGK